MTIKQSLCAIFITASLLLACQHPPATKDPALLTYFPLLPPGDTLHLEIVTVIDTNTAQLIPSGLFFKEIPAALLEDIDYTTDPEQAQVYGRQQFPLADTITACWVEIRQYWFQHHLLLLYNKRKKAFTNRVMVAEWYGGEGGQILTGSWLFDYDGDGKKDIVHHEIQHTMIPGDEEPLERIEESATLLLWKNGRFTETPLADTAAVVKRYPIRSFW